MSRNVNLAVFAVLHLKKDVTFARLLGWDKGTAVNIRSAEVIFSFKTYCSVT